MKFRAQKQLASRMLDAGAGRIWFDPLRLEDIKQAITREDIRELIKDRAIRIKHAKPQAKNKAKKKRKAGGRRIRVANRKRRYIDKIRKMRGYLDQIYAKGEISNEKKDRVRKLAKAGHFRSLRHLIESLKTIN